MSKINAKVSRIIFFAIICVLGILVFVYFFNSRENSRAMILTADSYEYEPDAPLAESVLAVEYSPHTEIIPSIFVFITGEIYNPGVFELYYGQRVFEAIDLAGGLTSYANENAINLAAVLFDTQHIIVPHIDDEIEILTQQSPNLAQDSASLLVNINTASSIELQTLPGIGPSRASSIISFRENNGAFASIESIMNVSGIGQSLFDSIRHLITV